MTEDQSKPPEESGGYLSEEEFLEDFDDDFDEDFEEEFEDEIAEREAGHEGDFTQPVQNDFKPNDESE